MVHDRCITRYCRNVLVAALMAVAGLCATGAGVALAQMSESGKVPPLNEYAMDPEAFKAQTDEYQETPFDDKFLAYTVRLPKGWSKRKIETEDTGDFSRKLLGEVARYYGPMDFELQSRFVIQASELDYEITAKNWFVNYVLSRGYTLQGMSIVSDKRIEAVFVLLEGGQSQIVRAAAEVNGSRLILAMYYVPEQNWVKEREIQANAIRSFQFLSPERAKIEETHTYAFLDLLRFDYPASWRLMAPSIYSIEAMDAKIITSFNTVVNGEIDVHVVSTEADTTLADEVKNVRKVLDDKNLLIGKLIEQPEDYKVHDHVYFSRVEVYKANDPQRELVDYEYWIGILMEDRYFYIITMLTPARGTDFYVWARNGEAFRTVVESFRM